MAEIKLARDSNGLFLCCGKDYILACCAHGLRLLRHLRTPLPLATTHLLQGRERGRDYRWLTEYADGIQAAKNCNQILEWMEKAKGCGCSGGRTRLRQSKEPSQLERIKKIPQREQQLPRDQKSICRKRMPGSRLPETFQPVTS